MSILSSVPTIAKVLLPLAAGAALAGAIAWGASRGGAHSSPASGPAAAAVTPPAEKTPGPPPWDPRRPDCPPGWVVYNDPDGYFSLCHQPGLLEGAPERVVPSEGVTFYVTEPANRNNPTPSNVFSLNLAWRKTMGLGAGPPSPVTCPKYSLDSSATSVDFVQLAIGGRTLTGCLTRGHLGVAPSNELNQLQLWLPVAADGGPDEGFVKIRVNYAGPDLKGTFNRAQQILNTLRFR
jgi:hypothetical protein